MSENGTIHITMMKNWVCHILFLNKKGAYRLPDSAKKGAIGLHIHTMSDIGSPPPTPPPRVGPDKLMVGSFILDLILILRERRLRWFGHVERS